MFSSQPPLETSTSTNEKKNSTKRWFNNSFVVGSLFSPNTFKSTKIMREALHSLQQYGLSESIFKRYWNAGVAFAEFHKDILIYLITGKAPLDAEPLPPPLPISKRLAPAQALTEIKELDMGRINLLQNWYIFGLRGDTLRRWIPGPEKQFLPGHEAAAEFLIKSKIVTTTLLHPLEFSLDPINSLSESEAWHFYRTHNKTSFRR